MQLGAGVAIALGIALGYLVITQRWQNLVAIFTTNPAPSTGSPNAATNVISGVTSVGKNGTASGTNLPVGINPNGQITVGGVVITGINGDKVPTVTGGGPGQDAGLCGGPGQPLC